MLVLVLNVDALILTSSSEKLIAWCKELTSEFNMKYISLMRYYLSLEVWQGIGKVFLGQGKYIVEILKKFQMTSCNPLATPMVLKLKLIVDSNSDLMDSQCTGS